MVQLTNITPFVVVSNIEDSIAFYKDVLGFSVQVSNDFYAFMLRDTVGLRLILAGEGKDLTDSNAQQHCYIDVDDIDDLYEELEPNLSQLPEGRVRPPFNTDYGQREFHVIDNDVLLISFGGAIHSEQG